LYWDVRHLVAGEYLMTIPRHGHRSGGQTSPTIQSYYGMVQRCTNPKREKYPEYGGVGVTVCDRWLGEHGFEYFLADMGERPAGKTLDRYPNPAGNYEPSNCRWATAREQCSNQRRNANKIRGVRANGTRFQAIISIKKKQINLGTFGTEREAAEAYNKALLKIDPESASVLNQLAEAA
jgi:AP2 domain